jgi:hypothetical protein
LPLEDGYSSFIIFLIRGNWRNRLPYASQQTWSLSNTVRGKTEGRVREKKSGGKDNEGNRERRRRRGSPQAYLKIFNWRHNV